MYLASVEDFRTVRRTLPQSAVFNLQYETWSTDEAARVSVLGRLVEFIGAFVLFVFVFLGGGKGGEGTCV